MGWVGSGHTKWARGQLWRGLCLSVGCVGHTIERCESVCTDRDAAWETDSRETREPCVR